MRIVLRQVRLGRRYLIERRLDLGLADGAGGRDGDSLLGLLGLIAKDRLLGRVVLLLRGGDDGAGGCWEGVSASGVGFRTVELGSARVRRRDQLPANAVMKPPQGNLLQ